MPGAPELPDALLKRAVQAAEGVPLFLEQFMISLIEEHRRAPDQNPKPTGVPLLLAEKMSGRLDRRPGARRIVQAAACIGRSFAPAFLAALLQQEPQAVPNHSRRWSTQRYCCLAATALKFSMSSGTPCCSGSPMS